MAQAALIPSEEDLVDIASAADQLVDNIKGGSFKANLHEIFNERAKPQKEQLKHLKSEIKCGEAKIKNIQARIKIDLRPMIAITNDNISKIYGDEERIVNIMRSTSPRERKKMMYPTKTNTSENIQSTSTVIATSLSSSSSTSTSTATPNALQQFNKKHYDQEKKESSRNDLEKKESSRKRKVVTILCQ